MLQALLGITIGILAGNFVQISSLNANLVAVVLVTSIDSVIGALRSKLEKNFNDKTMIIGFGMNLIAALTLLYLGSYLNINLQYMAFVAFSIRIFKNLSLIRCYLVKNL